MPEAVIGVDIGTSGVTAAAFDVTGDLLASSSGTYALYADEGHLEQDPDEILEATTSAIAGTAARLGEGGHEVSAVVVATAMHGLMAVDESGVPLTRFITWADRRALDEAEGVRASPDGIRVYERTGTPVHPMSPFAKLLWFRNHDREMLRGAARWISIKEHLFHRLFGRFVTDVTTAATTGLRNLETGRWDEPLLRMVGVGVGQLPEVVDPSEIVGRTDADASEALGLPARTPFIAGASDGVCANLGAGAVEPEDVACSIGTSGAVRRVLQEPRLEAHGRLFCYPFPEGRWLVGTPFNSAAAVIEWVMKHLLGLKGEDRYTEMESLAGGVEPGCDGVVFLPHLLGERGPQWEPNARGALVGLKASHTSEHVARAALEGVAVQAHLALRLLERTTGRASALRMTGGMTESAFFSQVLADVMDRELLLARADEGTALGAALLGMRATGLIDDLREVSRMTDVREKVIPDADAARRYPPVIEAHLAVWESLGGS